MRHRWVDRKADDGNLRVMPLLWRCVSMRAGVELEYREPQSSIGSVPRSHVARVMVDHSLGEARLRSRETVHDRDGVHDGRAADCDEWTHHAAHGNDSTTRHGRVENSERGANVEAGSKVDGGLFQLSEGTSAASSYAAPRAPTSELATDPRVLVALSTGPAWSRGVLRGFMAAAQQCGWMPLHYHPSADLNRLAQEWAPAAAVIGPEPTPASLGLLAPVSLVSVMSDRSADRIASVCLDEEAIAQLALEHLLATGLEHLSTFRLDESPSAQARERAFIQRARAAGVKISVGWGSDDALAQRGEDAAATLAWLRDLPKPCGVFTCTDSWGRTLARYARVARLRVPEDLALVGADNDVLECELTAPLLSSVMIPWQEVGIGAAKLVHDALAGRSIAGKRLVISPVAVVARRSSDVLAVEDALVAKAVRWIRSNAERRVTVPMVARAVGGGRQRLERRFRKALDRSVLEEIRRAHVDIAKRLLATTEAGLSEVAKQSGFTNAALLSVAFHRELGMPPGAYRRSLRHELGNTSEA
jgi:LacI family transcriptional regulator